MNVATKEGSLRRLREQVDLFDGCLAHLRTGNGRRRHPRDEKLLTMSNLFVSDEGHIGSSKAFRVLCDRTQVFTKPRTSLVRNRMTHVIEVMNTACVISEKLGLNTDLVRAASLGHDIGHGPFGHPGEHWISKAMGRPEFCHEVMGVVIAQKVERKGKGLNLCHETLEAMLRHSGNLARQGMSQEAWVLRFADKFTYLFHDVNDIHGRMEYPIASELRALVSELGEDQRERATTLICGLILESAEQGRVSFEESELARKFNRLRKLMYEVYPRVTDQNVGRFLEPALNLLSTLSVRDPFLLLTLMTDKDVMMLADGRNLDMQAFMATSVSELYPYLHEMDPVDLCDPDLDW